MTEKLKNTASLNRAAISLSRKKLGEILIERKLITPQELDEVLETQHREGGRLGEILVKKDSFVWMNSWMSSADSSMFP